MDALELINNCRIATEQEGAPFVKITKDEVALLYKALQEYEAIKPELDKMIEARKKIPDVKLEFDGFDAYDTEQDEPVDVLPERDDYFEYLTVAANIAAQLGKIRWSDDPKRKT